MEFDISNIEVDLHEYTGMNTQRLMFLYGALNKIIELEFDISQAPFIASTSTILAA